MFGSGISGSMWQGVNRVDRRDVYDAVGAGEKHRAGLGSEGEEDSGKVDSHDVIPVSY